MLAQFGFGVFVLTFLLALFSVGAAVAGYFSKSDRWVETARLGMLLTFPLITLAVLALGYLLVTGHYELQYVYSVTSNDSHRKASAAPTRSPTPLVSVP